MHHLKTKEKKNHICCQFFLLTDYLQFRRFSFSCASQILSTAHEPSRVTLLHTLNDKVASAWNNNVLKQINTLNNYHNNIFQHFQQILTTK